MPSPAQAAEQTRQIRLSVLEEKEKAACSEERSKLAVYALMLWFLCVMCWKVWPYFLNPVMWPKTLYTGWLAAHIIGHVGAVLGGLFTVAWLFSRGRLFDSDEGF
jgi:hypothetical protein